MIDLKLEKLLKLMLLWLRLDWRLQILRWHLPQEHMSKPETNYRAAVGEEPKGSLEYPTTMPKVPDSLQRAIAIALEEHPSINELKHLVKMTEINSKIADLSTGFTVSLGSSVSLDEEGESSGELSIRASGPIFSGGKLYSSSRKAIALNEQTLARLYSAKISIEQKCKKRIFTAAGSQSSQKVC